MTVLHGKTSGAIVADVFADHLRVVQVSAEILPASLDEATRVLAECLRSGGKVLACGNGGSAADAQHFVAELVGRVRHDRRALAAISLATDGSTMTAVANDLGYERVFSRQVEALARSGDVLVAISTSGRSPNVLAAARAARELECRVIAFTGLDGAMLGELADVVVAVPSTAVPRIQEVHELCLHALAEALESIFAGEAE